MTLAPYPRIDGTHECADLDPELFFPTSSDPINNVAGWAGQTDRVHPAVAACRRCPFLRPCLAYAITHDVAGIWGATFEHERDQIRRKNGIRPDRTGLSTGSNQ